MPLPKFRGRGRTGSVSAWVQGGGSQPVQRVGAVLEAGVKVPEIQAWSPSYPACVTIWATHLLCVTGPSSSPAQVTTLLGGCGEMRVWRLLG